MKRFVLLIGAFARCIAPAVAKEAPVDLAAYVKSADAIAICKVEKDNGDGTVTAGIVEVIKGKLRAYPNNPSFVYN
ncbi:MAG: hypothetical protein L0Z55_01050 [Planctomycetes bacterium]|nr:hypothetical protein [Planctomycetota bacterium]